MYQSRYGLPQTFHLGWTAILSFVFVTVICICGAVYLVREVSPYGGALAAVPVVLLCVLPLKLKLDNQAVTVFYLLTRKVYKMQDIADVYITRQYVRTKHGERTVRILMLTLANGRERRLHFPGPRLEQLKALIRQGIQRAGEPDSDAPTTRSRRR